MKQKIEEELTNEDNKVLQSDELHTTLRKQINYDQDASLEVSIVVSDYKKWPKDDPAFCLILFKYGSVAISEDIKEG